jgi:hypothetical protein
MYQSGSFVLFPTTMKHARPGLEEAGIFPAIIRARFPILQL